MKVNQTDRTKNFNKMVKSLKDTGKVKAFAEIVEAIGWDKTSLSNVQNGRANVPDWVYNKFVEVYDFLNIENADKISMETLLRLDAKSIKTEH